jgi:hypothetical protein
MQGPALGALEQSAPIASADPSLSHKLHQLHTATKGKYDQSVIRFGLKRPICHLLGTESRTTRLSTKMLLVVTHVRLAKRGMRVAPWRSRRVRSRALHIALAVIYRDVSWIFNFRCPVFFGGYPAAILGHPKT